MLIKQIKNGTIKLTAVKYAYEYRKSMLNPIGLKECLDLELSQAFPWDRTPEGQDYWEKLDESRPILKLKMKLK